MTTIEDWGRAVTFVMALYILIYCAWLMHRKRASWRVIVPVMLWASSIGSRVIVAVVVNPPSTFLNQWSRMNVIYTGILICTLLALLYTCLGKEEKGT